MNSTEEYWSRFWRQRQSRRRALAGTGAGIAGVAGFALVGCGDDDDDDDDGNGSGGSPTAAGTPSEGETPTGASPVRGGTHVANQTSPHRDVMDPHTSLAQAAYFYTHIGNLAVRANRDATELGGELVESWEIPGDGTEILLTIRSDVMWHDKPPTSGRAMTSEDIAYNIVRISGKLDPDNIGRYQRRSLVPNLDDAEAVDESTVRVTLTAPHSAFLRGLGDWRNTMIPQDFAESSTFEDPSTLVGSGAWIMESFDNEVSARFAPNPNYWEPDYPYLDAIEWVWLPDASGAVSAFGRGDIDYIGAQEKITYDTVRQTAPNAREESWVFGSWDHFRFNCTRPPFDNPMVRQAIQRVMDIQTMGNRFYGEDRWNFTGPLSHAFPEAFTPDEIIALPQYNPDEKEAAIEDARQLMSAAGHEGGAFSFNLVPSRNVGVSYDNAIRLADDLQEAFPDMSPNLDIPPDFTTFGLRQVDGDFDIISYTLFPAPDALLEMHQNYASDGSRNYGKFASDEVDSLLAQAQNQLDEDERTQTLKEAQTLLIEEEVPMVLTLAPLFTVMFAEKVRGMEGYGRRIGGGSFDTLAAVRHMWFDES